MLIEILLMLIGLGLLLRSRLRTFFNQRNSTQPRNLTSNSSTDDYVAMAPTAGDQLHNIYYTAWLLRQKLVPDVIAPIMHHAGLFQRHVKNLPKARLVVRERSAPHTVLVTEPIQSSARLQHPVRKVVFAIRSNDQGWVSDLSAGSWSWFTAGVVPKPEDAEEGAEPRVGQLSISEGDGRDRFIDRERLIFRNDLAIKESNTHIIEWTVDSEDAVERSWVQNLQNGERVVVRAWAQYAGWINHVESASIAIYTAAII